MQLANGTYNDMQLYTNDGAFFYLIDENDIVEITVNGTKYILDANNPTLELQLEFGDEVVIESSNPLGVYYDTEFGNMFSGEHYYVYTEE